MKNFKKIILFCLISFTTIFSTPLFKNSVITNVSAMPSKRVGIDTWRVWGTDLEGEKGLARSRNCPQGIDYVISLIEKCQTMLEKLTAKRAKLEEQFNKLDGNSRQ